MPEYLASADQTTTHLVSDKSHLLDTKMPDQSIELSKEQSESIDPRRYQFSIKRQTNRVKTPDVKNHQSRSKMFPLAVVGFLSVVLGILGIISIWATASSLTIPILILFFLGGIFGFISLSQTKRSKWKGRGFAIAAVTIFLLAIGLLAAGWIAIFASGSL
ncbi:MAG: DUF308 domain-containing protein [Reichenbachiella sp.]